MAYNPVSKTVPQYSTDGDTLASGYYLKAYQNGTTTPLSMATDNTGGTTLAKAKLNAKGQPISNDLDETTVFIPHFNEDFKLALYLNATDADNNTTANADWVVDNIRYTDYADATTLGYTHSDTNAEERTLRNRLEDIRSVKDFGVQGDGSTDDTVNINEAIAQSSGGILFFPEGTYICTGLTVGVSCEIRGAGIDKTIIKPTSSTGTLNLIDVDTVDGFALRDLTLDLLNTTNTFAGGYVANRVGLYVHGASNAVWSKDATVERVRIQNSGESGIFFQYMTECDFTGVKVTRCGQYGMRFYSCSKIRINRPYISDIYPGNAGTSPYLNAYGITFTKSGTDDVCSDCEVNDGWVDSVTSWEAYDTHDGKRIRFNNCSSYFCNQGVAVESVTAGSESEDISILGGTHTAYSQAYSRDGQTYEPSPGIVCNIGSTTTNGEGLIIRGALIRGHGSGRDSSGGAITVQDSDGAVVTDNVIIDPLKRGIAFRNEAKNVLCRHNVIQDIVSVGSVSRGIEWSTTAGDVTGHIGNNYITGATNQPLFDEEVTIAAGVITVYADFHHVDTEADAASDDLDTINGGWEGRIVTLAADDSARTVVCKNGTGNLRLGGAADFSLTHVNDTITLIYDGTNWVQLAQSDNET